jgi:large repetitive protein
VIFETTIYDVDGSVNSLDIIDPLGNTTVDNVFCEGDTISLVSSTASEYNWQNGDNTQSLSVDNSGAYSVTLTDNFGCLDTLSQDIQFSSIDANISVTETSGLYENDNFICQGDTAQITVIGGQQFIWNTGETQQGIQTALGGIYEVTISDNIGCTSSTSVIIESNLTTFAPIQTIESSGLLSNDGTICKGDTTTIIASEATSYLWSTGESDSILNIFENTTLHLERVNQFGCSSIDSVTIDVIQNNISIETIENSGLASNDGQLCPGDTALIIASGAETYNWNNGLFLLDSLLIDYEDTFVLDASIDGCIFTDSISLMHSPVSDMDIDILDTSGNIDNDGVICLGDTASLVLPTNVSSPIWEMTNSVESLHIVSDTTVIGFGYDGFNCLHSDTVTITQISTPQFTFLHDQNPIFGSELFLCQGDTAMISTSGDATQWSYNNTDFVELYDSQWIIAQSINQEGCITIDSLFLGFDDSPEVDVTIHDSSGTENDDGIICQLDTVTLAATASSDIIWSTGSVEDSIFITESGFYKAFVFSEHGYVDSDSAFISVRTLPNASINAEHQSGESFYK